MVVRGLAAGIAAGGGQRPAQAHLELLAEALPSPLGDQEGEPRLAAGLAGSVVAKDERDRRRDLGRFPGTDEGVERRGEDGSARSLLAADGQVEADDLLAFEAGDRGGHRDILRLTRRAVLGAPRDRHVELARQVGERLVPDEDPLELARDLRRVEELLRREPGGRAADDAADIVHPRLQGRETGRLEARDHLGHALDAEPAKLDLLAGGDVGDVPSRLHRDLAEEPHLRRGDDPVRHADPHHEVARCRPAMKDARPLEPLLVVIGDGLPALAGEPHEVVEDVEPVLFRLERLDPVHGRTSVMG